MLQEATRRHPEDLGTWLNLALAQRGMGNLGGAAASLRRVLALEPGDETGAAARAASLLARVEYEQGHAAESAAAGRQAIGCRTRATPMPGSTRPRRSSGSATPTRPGPASRRRSRSTPPAPTCTTIWAPRWSASAT